MKNGGKCQHITDYTLLSLSFEDRTSAVMISMYVWGINLLVMPGSDFLSTQQTRRVTDEI